MRRLVSIVLPVLVACTATDKPEPDTDLPTDDTELPYGYAETLFYRYDDTADWVEVLAPFDEAAVSDISMLDGILMVSAGRQVYGWDGAGWGPLHDPTGSDIDAFAMDGSIPAVASDDVLQHWQGG